MVVQQYDNANQVFHLVAAIIEILLDNTPIISTKKLAFLKDQADYIIDTSNLLIRDLRKEIDNIFVMDKDYKNLFVTVLSFGFKYGVPADCDLVFDVRFLPNPYYEPKLKKKTGNDKEVKEFVLNSPVSEHMIK